MQIGQLVTLLTIFKRDRATGTSPIEALNFLRGKIYRFFYLLLLDRSNSCHIILALLEIILLIPYDPDASKSSFRCKTVTVAIYVLLFFFMLNSILYTYRYHYDDASYRQPYSQDIFFQISRENPKKGA